MKNSKIEKFLSSAQINVKKEEITSLKNKGFVILRRNKSYWKELGIDLGEVKKIVEQEIIKSKKNNTNFEKDETYRYEKGTNRLSNILAKNIIFSSFIAVPDIVYCAKHVLGNDFQLSSMGMREPLKNYGYQGLHLDWKQRESQNSKFYQLTCFVLLDKVSKNNGPPRIIPKSHILLVDIKSTSREKSKRTKTDHEALEKNDKGSFPLCGNIGDIIIINVNAFHGGSTNLSGKRRRLIHIDYRQKSERPQVNHYTAIPKHLHNFFNNHQAYFLNLKKISSYQQAKRFAYNNRNNFFIRLLLKVRSLILGKPI